MKKILLGAAAAFAISAPAAHASAVGYLGAGYAHSDAGSGTDNNAWGAEGSVAFTGAPSGLGAAVDGSFFDGDQSDDEVSAGTGHIFWKNDNFLVGGFVGVTHFDDGDEVHGGGEAQIYFTNTTLGLSLVTAKDKDADIHAWGGDASLKYFLNDNFSISGGAGVFEADDNPGNDSIWRVGVATEYQLKAAPISLTAGYDHVGADGVDANLFKIGARWNFGGTLKQRNHGGGDLSDDSSVGLLKL